MSIRWVLLCVGRWVVLSDRSSSGSASGPEPELLAQLGFALDAALVDLLGEQPGADLPPADAVAQAVGGEGLGDAAGAGSGVHPDPRPGDEPEWTTHQATSSPAGSARRRARAPGTRAAPAWSRRGARARRAWSPAHLEADPVARLGRQGAAQRRGSSDAALTTLSRATMSAKRRPSIGRATGSRRRRACLDVRLLPVITRCRRCPVGDRTCALGGGCVERGRPAPASAARATPRGARGAGRPARARAPRAPPPGCARHTCSVVTGTPYKSRPGHRTT